MIRYTKVDEAYAGIFSEIMVILLDTYTEDGCLIWLNSRNTTLQMQRPIDLVNAGRGLEVRGAAYALEAGG